MLEETQTSICNKALLLIGEEPINSMIDSSTKQARVCKEFFYTTLRAALEEGQWSFATIEEPVLRYQLPEYTKEQKYVFQIPSDCAIVVDVFSRGNRKYARKHIDWDIRYIPALKASAIICDKQSKILYEDDGVTPVADYEQDEQIMMEYISDTQITYSYTASFIKYLAAQLAVDICMPLTHDAQRMQMLAQYAEGLRTKALLHSLNQDKQDKELWTDPLTASRERGWW